MASGTKSDYVNTMRVAAFEIRQLRKSNEILSAQMHVVNIFASALGFKSQSMGAGEDVAWRLDKHIEAIKEDIAREEKENK